MIRAEEVGQHLNIAPCSGVHLLGEQGWFFFFSVLSCNRFVLVLSVEEQMKHREPKSTQRVSVRATLLHGVQTRGHLPTTWGLCMCTRRHTWMIWYNLWVCASATLSIMFTDLLPQRWWLFGVRSSQTSPVPPGSLWWDSTQFCGLSVVSGLVTQDSLKWGVSPLSFLFQT